MKLFCLQNYAGYLKNHWANTRRVCNHLSAFSKYNELKYGNWKVVSWNFVKKKLEQFRPVLLRGSSAFVLLLFLFSYYYTQYFILLLKYTIAWVSRIYLIIICFCLFVCWGVCLFGCLFVFQKKKVDFCFFAVHFST